MEILSLLFTTYGFVGTGFSIAGVINPAIKKYYKTTAEELFKQSFERVVKQNASEFADQTDPKTVEVDPDTFDNVIASLKDVDEVQFTKLNQSEKIAKITTLFRPCIIVPNHQLPDMDFERRIRPIIERVIIDFYSQLPFNQRAFNQIILEFIQNNTTEQANADSMLTDFIREIEQVQSEVSKRLTEDIRTIKNDTEEIKEDNKEIMQTTQATYDLVREFKSLIDINTSPSIKTEVAKEHQAQIDNARNLLKSHRPITSLELLEDLKERTRKNTSDDLKFSILTNMAAARLALNDEKKAAKLLIKAFRHKPEDEIALSNRALAHFLLEEMENAEDYAKQTLEKDPADINAHVVLSHVFSKKEPLEQVIAQVPEYLRKTPQIAQAFSDIAKEDGDFKEARKWREIMVEQEEADLGSKASLATVLIEQVLDDGYVMYTKQLDDSQREQLYRVVDLLSEAWNCVADTELRSVRTDWIINRSMALRLLGESEAAIKDIDLAIENEPSDSTLLPTLLRNRGIFAFEQGNQDSAIDFFERIQSEPENIEAQLTIANILLTDKLYDEAITKLNDLLKTNLSSELQDEVNRRLVRAYIADERIEEAQSILKPMQESSPTNIFNLINAALISSKMGNGDKTDSILQEAYKYALDSTDFLEIVELAAELFNNEQFKEAATLYEKLADTSQNSQLTQWLVQSYYNSGEIAKALEICQKLREKYGPLENISVMEVVIYEEIGDMIQAETVCKEYLEKFTNDNDMRIRLGTVLFRSNKEAEIDNVLDNFSDFKNFSFLKDLSLEACYHLTQLYRGRSKPEKALQVMYETRRTHLDNPAAHLIYIELFYQVEKSIPHVLNPSKAVQDTAVQTDNMDQDNWYIIEDRDDPVISRGERNVKEPIVQKMLGKSENDEVIFKETSDGPKIEKIVAIKSKFVHAKQESFRNYEHLFPTDEGMETVKLDTSDAIDDKERFKPIYNRVDRHHEDILKIEKLYKEKNLTIGTFARLVGRNSLDTWGTLRGNPELGIRCSIGDIEERTNALNLLHHSQPKLVADIISLITLHSLDAADLIVSTFGKLCIAHSTIEELQNIIIEREGMWSNREGMVVGKQGNRYVKQIINPEDTKRSIEYLKNLINWINDNCEVGEATVGSEMNQLRRRKLNDMLQQHFLDTVLLASQPGYLLYSDDGRLRHYAKTSLNSDAGTNFQIDGVWTQVLLEHCVQQDLLDKADYDEMTIKLVCSRYYHTQFDADLLMEVAKRSNWKLSEPYNSFVLALGRERMNLQTSLDVCVDFLFTLWDESISFRQKEFLTLGLLTGLTYGRDAHKVLDRLEYLIQNKHRLFLPVENSILRQIRNFQQIYPFEDNFMFLAENDIRLKGTRVGIETILYEYIYNSRPPEVIADRYYTPTLEQIYATILYYLQNQEEVGAYLQDYLSYCIEAREKYEKNPPPGVVRLRKLIAEKEANSDISDPTNPKNGSASTTQSPSKNEQE